ncbi:uncharacterized protein KD926_005008 [Aspergillus affinis]|uniref:uncharacterized protein n=1 Tax=Aspergillus affinis TaxID=1070780 RepID=UPI0022FEC3ED|nr:uncharacterized protein KD926_005008 [Aspergillus affinis]KAI9034927.1 hypothetical protein KD926_005008 [Aspergillus affinis]
MYAEPFQTRPRILQGRSYTFKQPLHNHNQGHGEEQNTRNGQNKNKKKYKKTKSEESTLGHEKNSGGSCAADRMEK